MHVDVLFSFALIGATVLFLYSFWRKARVRVLDDSFVLVTGVSTGIGEQTALQLASKGFQVIGTVRKADDGERLRLRCRTGHFQFLVMDLTDDISVNQAVRQVRDIVGEAGLWGLVNNAGIMKGGITETASAGSMAEVITVDLLAPIQLTAALIPVLRHHAAKGSRGAHGAHRGMGARIINVGSVVGIMASPLYPAYSAAKFGIEGFSDALRRELAPTGVAVSLVQPGSIRTPLRASVAAALARLVRDVDRSSGYHSIVVLVDKLLAMMTAMGASPHDVALAIEDALTAAYPQPRYRVGLDAWLVFIAALLPDSLVDFLLGSLASLAAWLQR